MKTRRLLALGAAALLLAAGPAGCRETPQEDGTLRIGVAVYKGEDTYISNMTQAMQESVDDWCAETGERIQVSISDAQESQNTQNEQIDRFLSLGYDVLCVNLVDRTDAARVVDKAREADVPLVFFNREPVQEDIDAWDKVYYVGSDARQSAQLQAQIVLDLWESDPAALDRNGDGILQYMMLEGESRHQDAVIRTEVSVQTLREAGVPLERVESGIANWDRNQAAALTESALLEYPEIELILCNNDDMALGAADAVERLGLEFSNIVGIDGTPQGVEAVDQGRLLGTVVMDYPAHGEAIFRLSRALALGDDPQETAGLSERIIRIPMYIYS
ncbi:MAG TPA: galactose ABC transporter substrate-binding protein [Candidatus Intestinimonas pullistercoris]|uniref:D-galactose/methyl-galactoside binding periplasmic protein MglB n=1 Tax=Candidatus Intestinimonas pullistercoris TaxID=2838623 RepID=A0A9D2NYZ9_9FIRM|nr:galactose ABC transporter substrate-binding protein [uncultured Intestinimonas sp.]HJC40151.1 galactose ABC transporter substrate-binding protein [Candidatus Intestinimonas pullistercoris]